MGDVIRKRILKSEIASLVLSLLLFIYIIAAILWNMNYKGDERDIRININQLLSYLQQSTDPSLGSSTYSTNNNDSSIIIKEPKNIPTIDYPYCVFDTTGKVVISTMKQYKLEQTVTLSTLGSNSYYSVPIVNHKTVKGLLLVDSNSFRHNSQIRLLIIEAAIALLLIASIMLNQLRIRHIIKVDVWAPVCEIHKSTKSILLGNMNQVVNYDYSGEIGELCHDFEQMRDELKNSYQREKKSREKERVLYASLSHDLKTPISIITGYLEQICYGVVKKPAEIQESAKHALSKTIILNKFIDDILEHSKAQLDQLTIQFQEIYAREYFDNLLREYENEARQQHYTLTHMEPPAVLISIDPNRIAQVIQNIVGNSIKYSNDNLIIDISFEIMEIDKRYLIINIKDNGRGIEASDLPFIFDLFYRGNKARTQNIPGSGMGLNISQYIIEKHGGHIECDSIMNAGTTISFSLPII